MAIPLSRGAQTGADLRRRYLISLGARVRMLRERQGVTLKRLAQLSGLSGRFIIEVEKGNANPSLTSLFNLARALETSLAGLLPSETEGDAGESGFASNEILKVFESHPREQVTRVLSCVSSYLEHSRGSHVALIGMRGTGKTTVGKILARRLNTPFYELDEMIEKEAGLTLREIFDLEGENYYRAVEEKLVERLVKKPPGVIAVGGGCVMNPMNLLRLKLHSFVVWLKASPESLIARVRAEKDDRPLRAETNVVKQLKGILERRTPYYAQADFVVNTTNKAPELISKTILDAFQKPADRKDGREKTKNRGVAF